MFSYNIIIVCFKDLGTPIYNDNLYWRKLIPMFNTFNHTVVYIHL